MVRSNGRAAFGAVLVAGGAEKVCEPRDPMLLPPPMRASAAETANIKGSANDRTTAKAFIKPDARLAKFISCSFSLFSWQDPCP